MLLNVSKIRCNNVFYFSLYFDSMELGIIQPVIAIITMTATAATNNSIGVTDGGADSVCVCVCFCTVHCKRPHSLLP